LARLPWYIRIFWSVGPSFGRFGVLLGHLVGRHLVGLLFCRFLCRCLGRSIFLLVGLLISLLSILLVGRSYRSGRSDRSETVRSAGFSPGRSVGRSEIRTDRTKRDRRTRQYWRIRVNTGKGSIQENQRTIKYLRIKENRDTQKTDGRAKRITIKRRYRAIQRKHEGNESGSKEKSRKKEKSEGEAPGIYGKDRRNTEHEENTGDTTKET